MTHDPPEWPFEEKASVEPVVKGSAVRCDKDLDWQLNWQRN